VVLIDSVKIKSSKIENNFLRIKTINVGASLFEIFHKKKKNNLILNLGSISNYKYKNFYIGATCGRYAGRISNAKFKIKNDVYYLSKNENKNILHGGKKGFDRLIWEKKSHSKNKIVYHLFSKHLDQGFPGNLNVSCTYELRNKDLIIKYDYISDKYTHVNLTNHCYWNLNSIKKKNIFNHDLKINATQYLEVNRTLIPTGKLKKTTRTINDFQSFLNIGKKIILIKKQKIKKISNTINQSGFDLTYIIKKNPRNYVASLRNTNNNIKVDIFSNLPGVQLYTSQGLRYKKKLFPYQGVCLETQFFPDSPNNKKFPITLIKPNKNYSYYTRLKIN